MMASTESHQTNGGTKVRLSDIAKQTGYSLATVSKALNGKGDISEMARQAIDKALKDSGYVRRNSPERQQRTIEVVFRDFNTIWALEVIRGILEESRRHGINVMIVPSGDRKHPDPAWAKGIIERQPIGAILVFSNLTDSERSLLQSHNIPFVVFDPSGNPALDDLSVQADNWMGGVIATRHLLELGHKRIGIITGPDEMLCSRARLDGYSAALAERGIPTSPELIAEGDFTTPGGYEGAMALLEDEQNRPTAIFAGSDLQAMGVYEAARQLKIRIPEDLSIIGFDDIQTAAYMGPALTTVRQPLQDMASTAARMIIDTTEGRQIQKRVILSTSLVVRDSTQRLAHAKA
ncbi:LacI family DNA-binding transcriptional regulator [Bifidobacterium miconisargentati]|uniref:LacI family DNA-binding transcriptional regulator n=1 Tax=Bifidobacterium miconisargentati TaxID=2834437 RepID=UPI001BDC6267|nr:LacI family DNA-binding transcriptional regulator [Bifidobacterium miconisargentati]MBW3089383.1 LacI family DNA-binding transcriptional regulator [Bifidobacterium miconisargentati]